jgi:hypothetical protein
MNSKKNLAVITTEPWNEVSTNPDGTRESGYWTLNIRNAGNLLNGGIFSLHKSQSDISYDQGKIVGIEVIPHLDRQRVVIKYRPESNPVDGSTLSWGQEKAYY